MAKRHYRRVFIGASMLCGLWLAFLVTNRLQNRESKTADDERPSKDAPVVPRLQPRATRRPLDDYLR